MNSVSPEHIAGLTVGATPTQIVILILLGIAVCSVIFIIMINLIKLYTSPILKELENAKADREILQKIEKEIVKISASLWSEDRIQDKIQKEITEHALNCPCRTQKVK